MSDVILSPMSDVIVSIITIAKDRCSTVLKSFSWEKENKSGGRRFESSRARQFFT
jgi:hypothetical protein